MKNLMRVFSNLLSLCLLWGAACLFAYPATEGSFERTLNVSGAVDLDVTTGSGNIVVRNVNSSTVRVRGLIRARDDWKLKAEEKVRYLESHPPIEQTGNVIRIGRIENRDYSQNVSISYELDVPADTRLKAKSGSGNVTAGGLNGPIDLSSGSGNVKASSVGGEVHAETGSGNIDIDSVRGGAQVNTGSGNIQALGIGGALKARTGSGSVKVEQAAPGDVDAEAGSGEIIVSGVRGALRAHTGSGGIDVGGDPSGLWSLHAGSGSVKIRLKPNAAFDLNAHTSSGRVTLDHPVTVTGTISPKDLKGKVRGGGPLIEVTTGSGDVHIQ
jgi:DUF4097 and DUF4098 domain-containing protein YvlB